MLSLLRLLVFISLAAFNVKPSVGDTYNASMCPTSLTCGDGVDIHYPFYLSDESEVINGTAYSYCGYAGMAIACVRGHPVLHLNNDSYTVLSIDYGNNTIFLADTDALDGGSCPRVRHNVTIPPPLGLLTKLSSSATDYLAFFFNCTFTSANPPPLDVEPINCRGFDGGTGLSYALPQPDVPPGGWPRACKEAYVVPVLRDSLWGVHNYSQFGEGEYGEVLKQGFQLTWDPSAGPCFECEQSKGQCSYNQTGKFQGGFLGCLCSDGRVRNPHCGLKTPAGKWVGKGAIAIGIVSAFLGAIFLSLLLMCGHCGKKFHCVLSWKRGSKRTPSIESFLQKHEAQHPKRYTYSEVKRMTRSFTHKLGQGGFGTVYKGNLTNGRQIAVKLLKSCKDDGQEFMNEVASISKTSHVNVVTLLGYCLQGSKRALIYEYMPNGSLERFAFGRNSEGENSLSWEKLFDIAVGVARGLEYLHRGCNTRIVHFDIKPHNVLLDQGFVPKISDFGLAKLCMQKESIISIDGARGTIGYIAPEVFSKQFGAASSKSDVYSYGMMILEMVGARKNVNVSADVSSKYFPQWIYEHLEEYCVNACNISVDTGELVRKMIIVGLWCIQLLPNNRPSMTRVVEMLESYADDLQIPPQSLLC